MQLDCLYLPLLNFLSVSSLQVGGAILLVVWEVIFVGEEGTYENKMKMKSEK